MKKIDSRQNPFIKGLFKLKTKKARNKEQKYIVDGYRIVKHAVESDCVDTIIVSESFKHKDEFEDAVMIPDKLMTELVETETPQGICAVVSMVLKKASNGKILLLDGVQDPGNMGTLIRTADAAGFSKVLLRKGSTDPYSQKALRSSMGSIMSIPIEVNVTIDDIKAINVPMYGAALEGGKPYYEYVFEKDCVLVIGNEGNGISEEVLELCEHRVYIPMQGDVESLNASIAGGILMFDMQKPLLSQNDCVIIQKNKR